MTLLFGRRAQLTVGSMRVVSEGERGLKVTFSVHKSVRLTENSARIEVYNLSDDTRMRLLDEAEERNGVTRQIVLNAGYGEDMKQIFRGDRAWVSHSLRGADWVTSVESLDGNALLTKSLPPVTFAPKATGADVFGGIMDAIQKGWDQIKKSSDKFDALKRVVYDAGFTVDGSVRKALERIAGDAGIELSIQDDALNVYVPDGSAPETGALLNEDTGLIGIPELVRNPAQKAKKGKERSSKEPKSTAATLVKGRCLLNGLIVPGHKFKLESKLSFGGRGTEGQTLLRAIEVDHVGDTHGGDESWITEWTAERLKA